MDHNQMYREMEAYQVYMDNSIMREEDKDRTPYEIRVVRDILMLTLDNFDNIRNRLDDVQSAYFNVKGRYLKPETLLKVIKEIEQSQKKWGNF